MIRAACALTSYLGLTWLLLVMFCLWPKQALALVSPQAYSRVVAQAEWIAYQAASRASVASAVSTAAAASSPASLAIRAVTGPVGWAALGVLAGVALYQTYYPASTLSAIQAAAAIPGAWTIPTYVPVSGREVQTVIVTSGTRYASLGGWVAAQFSCGAPVPTGIPSGWTLACYAPQTGVPAGGWALSQASTSTVNPPSQGTPTPATQPQIATYIGGLPSGDTNSIESNSRPLGANNPVPDSASNVQVVPVSPTDMPTTVKPTSQVGPSDIKIADNVPPPSGATNTQQQTQQSTTTTTTTTNPDGSKTDQKSTTASTSCSAPGGHESRTMGTVLAQHQATWNSSGLIGAVNLLKNLTWPTTLPVVDLPSTFFGTQHVDFNQWAWFFTALRTLVIAIASLAAYRIIFVGGA
ncbi:MAG: hypothetical protein EPO64_06330 [Nitrospirae bacterium]|nr:MAG: hypothetical protein EPO64_06330 [Nitrospirota bacterium]